MKKILSIIFISIFLCAGNAFATYINDLGGGNGSEQNLQQILDGLAEDNSIDLDAVTGADGDNDAIADDVDSFWSTGGTGATAATFIIEIAGYSNINTFGIYNIVTGEKITVFNGAHTAGAEAIIDIDAGGVVRVIDTTGIPSVIDEGTLSGNIFGFFLQNNEGTFYSDSSQNNNGEDHMVAFGSTGENIQLPGQAVGPWLESEYILAWEDVLGLGDHDYNDMVLMVESVKPVPEPATMLLLGMGLLGIGAIGRKKFVK